MIASNLKNDLLTTIDYCHSRLWMNRNEKASFKIHASSLTPGEDEEI